MKPSPNTGLNDGERAYATGIGEQLEKALNDRQEGRFAAIAFVNRHLIIAALYRLGEHPGGPA